MSEKKERNYKAEYERQNEINKTYRFKVPKYIAKAFDEKLIERETTAKEIFLKAIENFMKKN